MITKLHGLCRECNLHFRDIKKQQDETLLLEQQKVDARRALKNLSKQQDQQKDLSRKLATAKLELELLTIDEKHVSALISSRGQHKRIAFLPVVVGNLLSLRHTISPDSVTCLCLRNKTSYCC